MSPETSVEDQSIVSYDQKLETTEHLANAAGLYALHLQSLLLIGTSPVAADVGGAKHSPSFAVSATPSNQCQLPAAKWGLY